MSLDLDAIRARDTALRPDGAAWTCRQCDSCGECSRLLACPEHDDDDDVLALLAEVERLRAEVETITLACDQLKSDADAEVGRRRLAELDASRADTPVTCLCGDPDCWDELA